MPPRLDPATGQLVPSSETTTAQEPSLWVGRLMPCVGFRASGPAMRGTPQLGLAQGFDTNTCKREDGSEAHCWVTLSQEPQLPETTGNFLLARHV